MAGPPAPGLPDHLARRPSSPSRSRSSRRPSSEPLRLTGRIEGFDPGPNARVFAINEDENQADAAERLRQHRSSSGVFRTKLQGQPIDVPLSNVQLRGFAIRSVSPLDPSGWIRREPRPDLGEPRGRHPDPARRRAGERPPGHVSGSGGRTPAASRPTRRPRGWYTSRASTPPRRRRRRRTPAPPAAAPVTPLATASPPAPRDPGRTAGHGRDRGRVWLGND